jgi:lipopolysaccharide/colanic/teichoic acid biosynthesis glycosyltransferase
VNILAIQTYHPTDEWRSLFRLGPSHKREIVFGFLWRLLVGVVSVVVSAVILVVAGFFNGWQLTTPLLVFFGGFISLSVYFGEHLRSRVYERSLSKRSQPANASVLIEQIERGSRSSPHRIPDSANRVFDVVLALIALFFFGPMLVLTGVIVGMTSPGPILVRKERLGFHRRKFYVLKFRIMYLRDSDANMADDAFAALRDRRITPIGAFLRKSSIEELPALLNVLKGEMSLVGPRPLVAEIAEDIAEKARQMGVDRYSARPGMISLDYFVSQKITKGIDELARADAAYLQSKSLFLDLKILSSALWRFFSEQVRI